MQDADELPPGMHGDFVNALEDMADALRSIEDHAERTGQFEAWWMLVCQMIVMRGRMTSGSFGDDFVEAMEDLCARYDDFVATVLPEPDESYGKPPSHREA